MRAKWVVAALLGVVAAGGGFIVGMRRKSPLVQDRVRAFAKVARPAALKAAGGAGQRDGVVHHVGRTSGRPYATPVTPLPTPDGFVIALPYTSGADWARNVLAAGHARIEYDGRTVEVTDPVVVPSAEVRSLLSRSEQIVDRVFDLREYLRVTAVR